MSVRIRAVIGSASILILSDLEVQIRYAHEKRGRMRGENQHLAEAVWNVV